MDVIDSRRGCAGGFTEPIKQAKQSIPCRTSSSLCTGAGEAYYMALGYTGTKYRKMPAFKMRGAHDAACLWAERCSARPWDCHCTLVLTVVAFGMGCSHQQELQHCLAAIHAISRSLLDIHAAPSDLHSVYVAFAMNPARLAIPAVSAFLDCLTPPLLNKQQAMWLSG